MKSMLIQQLAENICKLGCSRVNEIIARLQTDQTTEETGSLDLPERTQLLAELKSVMAVYDQRR